MLMQKDINCINFKGLFAYIEQELGATAIDTITHGLVDNPEFQVQDKLNPERLVAVERRHLVDSAYWVSNAFSLQLLGNVHQVIQDPNPLFVAGVGAVKTGLSKSALFAGRLLGPSALVRQMARINSRFNHTKDVVVIRHEPRMVRVELHYHDQFEVTADVCNWNLGIYTGMVSAAGGRRPRSQEVRCVLRGDPCCEFHLTWKSDDWLKRMIRGPLVRLLRDDINEMMVEHEATLTERDQLISQLVRSEEKYRTLFEDSMEAMTVSRGGRIADVNPAWLALHGYTDKEEVVGRDVLTFIHPEDRPIFTRRRQTRPDKSERIFCIRDLRRDGSYVEVEVYSTRITVTGEAMILTTIRDITLIRKAERERAQLELRLQRVEKMEAMATLVGGVAHDLNNILSGIVSYPELLLMQIPEDSPMRSAVETIHDTGKRAAAIVQDLLTMARRAVVVTEVVDLNAVIANYLKSPEHRKMLSIHSDVAVLRELAPDVWHISGSPVHLNKTVMNLVSNAAEAMPDGGVIRIATENCTVDRQVAGYDKIEPGHYVRMTVSDNGIGIAPEDLHRIFEPFYTKKKMGYSGTGLGMSVVWGTVKDHNGFIDARSRPGKGTTFTLYFPMTEASLAPTDDEPLLEGYRGEGESILVVDDNLQQREIAHKILSELGYRVETVPSGEAALDWLKTRSVDVVILDMIMDPGIDGLETYRRLIAIHPGQKTLIASGFSETDRVRKAQRLGAGAFVRKPYAIHTIARAVKDLLTPSSSGRTDHAD